MKLKKFIAILLTAITAACVAVGFSGCKDENGDYCPPYPPRKKEETFTSFEDLKSYYETDFRKTNTEQFYLLTPEYEFYYKFWHGNSSYSIKGENYNSDSFYTNPIIIESVTGYSDSLGSNYDPTQDGSVRYSFSIRLELQPLSKDYQKQNNFIFEFKPNHTDNSRWNETIDIFDSEIKIAECLIHYNADISHEWLEDYFKRNLV